MQYFPDISDATFYKCLKQERLRSQSFLFFLIQLKLYSIYTLQHIQLQATPSVPSNYAFNMLPF